MVRVRSILIAYLFALSFRLSFQSEPITEEGIKSRFDTIAGYMDEDKDGTWSNAELMKWSWLRRMKFVAADAKEQMQKMDKNSNEKLEWQEYSAANFGTLSSQFWKSDERESEGWDAVTRDKRKWKFADGNGDESLDNVELRAFMYPEDYTHMAKIAAEDRMHMADKNQDGSVDEEEYIQGIFHGSDLEIPGLAEDERRQFKDRWDTNGDGKLDKLEARIWLDPGDDNVAAAEVRFLLHRADENKDGVLTKDEISTHYLAFTETQITNWGEDLYTT